MATNETNVTAKRSDEDEVVIVNNFNINHDPEDLVRYKGQFVAWSRDGREVLFAHSDPEKLFELCDKAGLKPEEYVLSGIPGEEDFIPGFGWGPLD